MLSMSYKKIQIRGDTRNLKGEKGVAKRKGSCKLHQIALLCSAFLCSLGLTDLISQPYYYSKMGREYILGDYYSWKFPSKWAGKRGEKR